MPTETLLPNATGNATEPESSNSTGLSSTGDLKQDRLHSTYSMLHSGGMFTSRSRGITLKLKRNSVSALAHQPIYKPADMPRHARFQRASPHIVGSGKLK